MAKIARGCPESAPKRSDVPRPVEEKNTSESVLGPLRDEIENLANRLTDFLDEGRTPETHLVDSMIRDLKEVSDKIAQLWWVEIQSNTP